MKLKSTRLLPSALIVVIATAATTSLSFAASGVWTNLTSGNWSTGPWTGGVPNGSTETATFNQNWAGQIITVDTAFTVGQILATDTTANGGLTISGGTLTLDNGGSSPIISTGTNNAFGESAANRFKISSVLDGANGFERQGNGYLDLSGVTNIFTGTIKLTAAASGGGSFTVINSDANLGNSANVITVATTSQPVGFYNDAAAGSFTLNSARTITTSGTGDFWVKNKAGANMTIAGVISGTANFRKNDGGIVTLTGENTYALATKLEGGTLRLSGGTNRLPTTTTVQFLNGTSILDLTNTTQSVAAISPFGGVTNTITGAGGSLTVTNNANFTVNAADATILDMSGLTNFTYNQPTKNFVVQPTTSTTTSNNTINLAKAGTNAITALNVTVGGATGTSQGTAHEGRLTLGTVNNFNTTNLTVGGFNGSGKVSFQSGLTTPALTLRGLTGGSSAVTLWKIGETSSGTRSGAGVFDLTGGSLDAIVTDLVINRHLANANTGITSSLTMPSGSVVATNILLGEKTGTGTPVLTTNFNQGGGTVKVSTLTFGKDAAGGATPDFRSSYNLSGGTLSAATIEAGTGAFATTSVRRIGWTGGTITNYDASTDLSINGVAGTGGSIILATSTATAKDFNVDTNRKITLGANTSLTGSSDLSKNGNGTLLINGVSSGYTGTLSINAGTLGGATSLGGNVTIGASGKLAPGASTGAIGTIATKGTTWTGGSIWEFDLSAGTPGSSDLMSIDGNFTKAGSGIYQFNFMNSAPTVWGAAYTLISWTGTTDFLLSDFSYTNLGGGYDGQPGTGFSFSGNSLVFTAVPEPTSALAGLLITAGLLRRRRSA
jgi:autotransporter-associated beta strand protein